MGNIVPKEYILLRDGILKNDNLFGLPPNFKARWAEGLNLPRRGERILFAGCGYQFMGFAEPLLEKIERLEERGLDVEKAASFTARLGRLGLSLPSLLSKLSLRGKDPYSRVLLDAVKILKKLGVSFSYLGVEEPCCGSPLYYLGFYKAFAEKASKTYKRLKEAGVKEVLSIVPACTNSLKNLYPKFVDGYDLTVKPFTEFLNEVLSRNGVKLYLEKTVTVHDPCQLARFLEASEGLRELLGRVEGLTVRELPTSLQYTMCCGGGAGLEFTYPELSLKIAVKRVRELLEAGVSTIVTCCPGCLLQLKRAVRRLRVEVEVLDVVELVAQALEGENEPA